MWFLGAVMRVCVCVLMLHEYALRGQANFCSSNIRQNLNIESELIY